MYIARLFTVVTLALLSTTTFSSDHSQILILHSYSQEYPWTKSQHEGFVTTYYAHATGPALISTEYLDTKRKPYNKTYANFFSRYLQEKYSNYQPDLVYVTDDNALTFALEHLQNIFPGAPVIFSGVNNYTIEDKLDPARVTGIFEKKDIALNLELLAGIDSNIHDILVVGDNSNTYRAIEHEIREQLKTQPHINANYIAFKRIDQLVDALSQHTAKYLFLTTLGGITDASGQTLALNETISRIVQSGEFVILSMEDAYLFDGVLGGFVTSGKRQGYSAAKIALDYKQGTAISQLPVVKESPNEYIFDYRQLVKNNLELPSTILDTATILHKSPSFYQRNRQLILGIIIILTVLLIASMAVFLLLLSRKNRQIQATSNKIIKQATALRNFKDTLTAAQQIAHLGNWEWNITGNKTEWSDELFRILGEKPQSFRPNYEIFLSYIPEDERSIVKIIIDGAVKTKQSYETEHKVIHKDGSIHYVRQVGNVRKQHDNKILLVGTVLDITTIKENELRELERMERVERYQDALFEWSRVNYKNIDEAFERATEISARTLDIKRASIWLYNNDRTSIVCHNLYVQDKGHIKGLELSISDYPAYFKALQNGKLMAITDARHDKRTKEFRKRYLEPNEIYSMLDVPILYQGEVIGVVCHEHTGSTKEWALHEQEFATAIANTVSLSLEMEKRREIEKKLEHQAYHDVLTSLPNRSLFMDRLDQAIKQAYRNNTLLAVLFIDLDNFKEINDSLGHAVGDQVLIQFAQNLQENLRNVDTIARLGGDEFTLIMGSFEEVQHVNDIAAKLFNILNKPMLIDNHELYITSSVGISIYPNDGETTETLLRNADTAMYKAKQEGRNSFQFYTQDMTERAFERVLMDTNLRRALEREEFIVHYQPQYDATSNTLIGMEALIRWQHPDLGVISPAKFIPVAEDTGLIVQLDRWVMHTAMKQLSSWYKQGLQPGRLALNLAMKQLDQEDLIEVITSALNESGCKPQWFTFEITESQIMKNPARAISILRTINDLGIEIAVDDFGTGYSSLTYLKRLPVNKLKIDQAFVRDIPEDDEDVAIVRAVIALAKSMKLSVIAEGVEEQKQVDFLLEEGCSQIQGYLYGTPMDAAAVEQLLKEQ